MIQHVTREIRRDQLEQCVGFYGLVGFQPVPAPAGIAGRATWLERGRTQVHLMLRDDATPQRGHVGIVVDDYTGTIERLRGEGYRVEPRREHWGSPRSYVRDPAGNLVELMAEPPGAMAEPPGATAEPPCPSASPRE